MRFTATVFVLLACGVIYDFTHLRAHRPLTLLIASHANARSSLKPLCDPHAIVRDKAKQHNVPAAFVKSIVAAESNFNPDAVSSKGAIGLMQLMPATAQEYGADPSIPEQNIDAGTQYLGRLLKRYRKYRNCMERTIAAYNAGPAVVDRYHGVPPYRETRAYVARVLAFFRKFQKEERS